MLETVDLSQRLDRETYHRRLPKLRARLLQLQQACWRLGVPSVLAIEGWDGAGKGACVRKLTERLEPRGYRVCYLGTEPRTYERQLPWMWRFWLDIPSYGQMTIFHSSWYRKAILDRDNGRLDELGWDRAFRSILDFERALADDGYVFAKVFLHITSAERQRRYRRWQKDPASSWKITPQDWKHHARYSEIYPYVEWMLERTETAWAPWSIIAATDPKWARIQVFEAVIERLEQALDRRGAALPDAGTERDDERDDEGSTDASGEDH